VACTDDGPDRTAELNELRRLLRDELSRLPEPHRVVATRYYLDHESTAQIAAALNVNRSTVKKRLHDARQKLKGGALGGEDEPAPNRQTRHPQPPRPDPPLRIIVPPQRIQTPRTRGPLVTATLNDRIFRDRDVIPSPFAAQRDHAARQQELRDLWRRYRQTRGETLRNRLLEEYLHLVRFHAQRLIKRVPADVEIDDLLSAGVLGLIHALDVFDPDKGIKFETFCAQRVRGAMIDELRSLDWAPRLVRSRARQFEAAVQSLAKHTGRRPSDDDLMAVLGVGRVEYERVRRDAAVIGIVSMQQRPTGGGEGRGGASGEDRDFEVIDDPSQPDPLRLLERLSLRQMLTRGMSRAERLIVMLYYYEQMTMHEIGQTLGMSESRVSQLNKSIVERLRARFNDDGAEEAFDVA
jgi:RNA polymerase sigma factor for flagellar operon FliA